jgi:type VI secretion system protein ImpE
MEVTMDAQELFRLGYLGDAVAELTKEIKAAPADPHLRSFLFELLCFQGEYDRAAKQLSAISSLTGKMETELGAALYSNLLTAERTRQAFFRGSALPKFFTSPPDYIERYAVLVSKAAEDPSQAEKLLAEAEEGTPSFSGRACEAVFAAFRDADDRIAPVFEVFQGTDYLWLPIEQVKQIQIPAPRKLRDLIWINARITTEWANMDVFMPALYPESYTSEEEEVRLGRKTEWCLLGEGIVIGRGQRVFLVDDREVPLLQMQNADFHSLQPEGESRD